MDTDNPPSQRPDHLVYGHHRISLREALSKQRDRWRDSLRDPRPEMHNERVMFAEIGFQAISNAGAMAFIAVFLVRLGAPNWMVGLDTALPALVTILTILPAGAFVRRQRSLIKVANWSRLIWRLIVGAFALLPLLPPTIAPYLLVFGRTLMSIPGSTLNVATTTILGQVTTVKRRPRMLSTRMALHGLVGAGVGFLAGQWLEHTAYPLNYQILFLSALAAGLGNIYCLSRLRLPEVRPQQIAQRKRMSFAEMFTLVSSARTFRNFAIAEFIFRMGLSMPSALFTIFRVRTLGSSDAWIGTLLTVERLVSVGAYFALGRLLTKPGVRKWLWVSCIGVALYPLTMALCTTPTMLLIPTLVAGLFSAGMDVFLTNTLFQVSPEEERPSFIAANTLLANVTAFVAPMLGTTMADVLDIRLALLCAGVIRIVGALSFWRLGVARETASAMEAAERE